MFYSYFVLKTNLYIVYKKLSDTKMQNEFQKIVALLGPTNTGKTHVAIEKMLQYDSGIFGLFIFSPFTMASYAFALPMTSSDLMVKIS